MLEEYDNTMRQKLYVFVIVLNHRNNKMIIDKSQKMKGENHITHELCIAKFRIKYICIIK